MVSSLSRDNKKSLLQRKTQSLASSKVVPAIPLSYIRKRTQHPTEHAKAPREVDLTKPVIDKEPNEYGHERPIYVQFPPSNISNGVDACEQNVGVFEPASLTVVRTKSQKVEGETMHEIFSHSDRQGLCTKVKEIKCDKVTIEEGIHSRYGSSQDGNSVTHHPKFVPTGNESYESNLAHRTPSDFLPPTLSQIDGRILESARAPSQRTLGITQKLQNDNFIICENSQSSKSSPAATESILYPPPSFSHVNSPNTCLATYSPNSHLSRNSPHVYSLDSHMPSPPHHIHTNEFINAASANNVIRESSIPQSNSEKHSSTVTPVESCQRYKSEIPLSIHETHIPVNDRDLFTPLNTQNSTKIISGNNDSRIDDTKVPRENSSADTNCNRYSQFPPILGSFCPQPDIFDGLIEYLSSQFADPTLADNKLELRYADDRETPIQIPGHNLIFARSVTLRDMILAMRSETAGTISKTLLIESNDRFLCNDGFYMAMHRLYGNPLLDLGPNYLNGSGMHYQLPSVSTVTERFNLALGYAAAGHLLNMHVVVNRGCEIAGLSLSWATLEKALDFALDGGLEPHWTTQGWSPGNPRATYGPSVNMIIIKVIEFICHNIPTNFELDVSVGNGRFALRLPKLPDPRLPPVNPRFSHIKFGDHATEESNQSGGLSSPIIILSRILISLPWDLLRCIFESSRLVNHYGSVTLSHQILSSIIREREKRRITVYKSRVPNSERNKKLQEWLSVGWKEKVEALSQDDMYPKLNRKWTDFNVPET